MWVNLCSMRQSQRHFRADSATKPSSEAPQQEQGLESICFLEGKLSLKSRGVPASISLPQGMQSQGNILSLMVPHDWLPCAGGKQWALGELWPLSPGPMELERPPQCCHPCGGAGPQEVCQEPSQCQPQQPPEQPGTGIQRSQPGWEKTPSGTASPARAQGTVQGCESPPSFGTVREGWHSHEHMGQEGRRWWQSACSPSHREEACPRASSCSQAPWAGLGSVVLSGPYRPRAASA